MAYKRKGVRLNFSDLGATKPEALFREGQEEAIRHVVNGSWTVAGGSEDRNGVKVSCILSPTRMLRDRREADRHCSSRRCWL